MTISNLSLVSDKAQLGENIQVGPYAIIEDDVIIGDNGMIGPHAAVYNGARIGNNVKIQAQSGIGRNVKDNETLQGSPALPYSDYNKSYVHFKNLPKTMNRINILEKTITND